MPIVTVEIVSDPGRQLEHNLTQLLADAIGHVLHSPHGQTWVRLWMLQRNEYAENGVLVDAGELPVFVTVLERQVSAGAVLRGNVTAITQAVADVLDRPVSCVHVEFAPAAAGRVSFGGKLVP
jgi:phenylpyruvate tautomerase PptA (4-oxalocrotonate tautomerase family)